MVALYEQFCRMKGWFTLGTVPNEVVNLSFETQAEVADRIGITQAAYAQMEHVRQPRKATLVKVTAALGIEVEQRRW